MKRSRPLLVTVALTAGLVLLILGLRGQYARFLAQHWRKQLDSVPDDQAAALVRAIAQLDEPGIPVLVEALGSDRESVARSGKRALLEEMEQWETLRAREYSPKLAILAKALADRVEQFGPEARAEAAELATRILKLWTLDPSVVDPTEVVASCEKVLRTASPAPRPRRIEGLPDPMEYAATGEPHRAAGPGELRSGYGSAADGLPDETGPLAEVSKLPGGGLPIELAEPGRVPLGGSDGASLAEARWDERPDPESTRPVEPLRQPQWLLTELGAGAALLEPGIGPGETGSPDLARLRATVGNAAGEDSEASRMAAVDTVELMRRLRGEDDRAAAAGAELARRGFTQLHLKLARQMFDPDPNARMELIRVLPEVPDIDAGPWLLELSRDADPEVRRLAITVIATTGDPAVLDAVETIAREDPDPRVRHQAERIAQGRQPARH